MLVERTLEEGDTRYCPLACTWSLLCTPPSFPQQGPTAGLLRGEAPAGQDAGPEEGQGDGRDP